jgi:hypothetical protein
VCAIVLLTSEPRARAALRFEGTERTLRRHEGTSRESSGATGGLPDAPDTCGHGGLPGHVDLRGVIDGGYGAVLAEGDRMSPRA